MNLIQLAAEGFVLYLIYEYLHGVAKKKKVGK